MPRRYADYSANDGFTTLNQVSTIGAFLLATSMIPFFMAVHKSTRSPKVTVDDPWGWGRSLEWATSCPPPRHNFLSLPRVRSESPAFDLHHPEVAALEMVETGDAVREESHAADAPNVAGRRAYLEEELGRDVEETAESVNRDREDER
jgi:cytochrome c oxidase subunit 1